MTDLRERFSKEKRAIFEEHARAWAAGEFSLMDFAQRGPDGEIAWYPQELNRKLTLDKAKVFEAIGYRPSLPACHFHASRARFKVFSGGARAGKSKAGAYEFVPLILTPGMNLWIVGPEYEQCVKEFEYVLGATIEHPVIGKAFAKYVERVGNRPHGGDMEIRMDFGDGRRSFLKVKTAQRMQSLLSEELDAVMVVEASEIPERAWSRMLKMRLATRHGMAIFPSSPSGMGWVAQLYQRGMDGEREHFAVNADSRMNPTQDLNEIELLASDLSDEDWNEQIEGRPMPRHGLVFPDFRHEIHVASWQKDWPKPSWLRGRAIDFGYSDPACILWIAQDEDKRFYVYREWYQTKRLVSDMIREIGRAEGWDVEMSGNGRALLRGRPKIETVRGYTVTDWDAAGRAELGMAGIPIRMADKDIMEGVRSLARSFRRQGDGRPRVYIHPSCVNLIRELQKYAWDGNKDEPSKQQSDHAIDPLRYYVHTLDPKGAPLKVLT